jgi:nicotinate dehydrogenase subunit B
MAEAAVRASGAAEARARLAVPAGARLFDGACASCHEGEGGIASLALNSNLHGPAPDNAIQAILRGIHSPAALRGAGEEMAMPGFAAAFGDGEVADLLAYMRARFAPGAAPWRGVADAVARVRGGAGT